MSGVVVVDTNLLLLLVVGSASQSFIDKHKRLHATYTRDDFALLGGVISGFSEMVLLPHILVEVSNLSRQIDDPARSKISEAFKKLVQTNYELPTKSISGVLREEFADLGLTDAVIRHLCNLSLNGINPTLLTVDQKLADRAHSLGYSVIDYRREFQDR